MNILFVYPNVTRVITPQIGIAMLAGTAKDRGHTIDLFDLTIIPEGEELSQFKEKVYHYKPDIIAFSVRSSEWETAHKMIEAINDDCIIIAGGPHVTASPEEVIHDVDIAVIGEGEETFGEILDILSKGEYPVNVKGSWIKENGKIHRNELRQLLENLDDLPMPNWQIFDQVHFSSPYTKSLYPTAKIIGTFEGSRGCPFSCSYCMNHYVRRLYKGKGPWRRLKSPSRIIKEMAEFRRNYELDFVYYIDEVILTNKKYLDEFASIYGSEIGVPFVFMERPENITYEKLMTIKKAGAKQISIGIEAGDEALRRNLLNRRHSQGTIIAAFDAAKKANLHSHAFTMIGFPGETSHSINETLKLLRRTKPDSVQTSIFYPIRGTDLFNKVVEEGFFEPSTVMPRNYYVQSSLKLPINWKKRLPLFQYVLMHYEDRFAERLAFSKDNIFGKINLKILRVYINIRKGFSKINTDGVFKTVKYLWNKVVSPNN